MAVVEGNKAPLDDLVAVQSRAYRLFVNTLMEESNAHHRRTVPSRPALINSPSSSD